MFLRFNWVMVVLLWGLAKGMNGQVCDPAGNLFIISNYDGGILTVNVDVDIPNLVIGINSYEPIQVDFQGPFVGNITQVVYAGFNSNQGNNNCGQGNFTTAFTGVEAALTTINSPLNPPPVGYSPTHGNGNFSMVGTSGSCDTTQYAGGGNTPDEIVYYFENTTSSIMYAHLTQYGCWQNDVINLSDGGSCCIKLQEPEGCDPNGNLVVYSNYTGGVLDIVVDQNIPNLKIGVVSYEATEISISGPFAANVTGVIYAGFDAPGNGCSPSINETSVAGVDPAIVTIYSITDGNIPMANYLGEPLDGLGISLVNCITGAEGDCGTSNQGGGNSAPQIAQFFLSEFGPGTALFSHHIMYDCFQSPYNVSDPGNCCLTSTGTAVNPIYEPGATYDFFEDEYSLCNGPLTLDLSFYPVLFQPPTYPGYVWSDGTTGPVIAISEPGVYSFTAGDYCHYDPTTYLTDTITVLSCCTAPDPPIITGTLAYCAGDAFTALTVADDGPVVTWYSDQALNNPLATGASFTPTNLPIGNTTYFVTANENNCESVATAITISVQAAPIVNITSSEGSVLCESQFTTLTANVNNNNAQIAWSTGSNASSIVASTAGTYDVTVSLNNCVANASFDLEVSPTPQVSIVGDTEVCPNTAVTLVANGASEYIWITGETGPSITIVINEPNVISVQGNTGNCYSGATITIWTLEGPELEVGPAVTAAFGEDVNISASTDGAFLSWLPESLVECDTCASTSVNTENSIELYATAIGSNGCLSSDTLLVLIGNSCNQIFIPNAFTPDNSQTNDALCIVSDCIDQMTWSIYDRWGQMVFSTNDPGACWNGGLGGYYVPDGVYNWILTGTDVNGDTIDRKGHVVVIR